MATPAGSQGVPTADAAISESLEEARNFASEKGLRLLLEYYGKVSGPETVEKILDANLGETFIYKRHHGPIVHASEFHSENRADNRVKFLVKVDRAFFDADWLKQKPKAANTLSFEEYKKLAPGGIVPIIEIETSTVEQKIKSLISIIDKEFKPRIRKYIANTGDQNTFKDLKKIKERINNFTLFLKRFMKINDLQYDNSKKDKLIFGFTKQLEPLFVAYAPEPPASAETTESQYAYEYLSAGVKCMKSIPSKDGSIFADQTSLGYLLYASKLENLIKNPAYASVLQKNFAGIKLLQKFTIPSPVLKPSKTEASEANKTTRKRNADVEEDTNKKNPKIDKDIAKTNEEITRTYSAIKKETNAKTYNAGDDVTAIARPVVEGADTAEDLYAFLQLVSIREFIIKATVCLKNSMDPTSAIDAATLGVISAMSPLNLFKMLGNGYFINELQKNMDPVVFNQMQNTVFIARDVTKIAENISNMKKILEENPTASQDFFNATKETARYYDEDFEGDINSVEGAEAIAKAGTDLDAATAVKAVEKVGDEGLPTKKIEPGRIEIEGVEYSDDALKEVDAAVEKGIDNSLNVTV